MHVKEKNKQLHQKGTSEFLRLDSSQLISLLNSNFPINMSESEVKKEMMETWFYRRGKYISGFDLE